MYEVRVKMNERRSRNSRNISKNIQAVEFKTKNVFLRTVPRTSFKEPNQTGFTKSRSAAPMSVCTICLDVDSCETTDLLDDI